MRIQGREYRSVWLEGPVVRMIDQRRLPHAFTLLACPTVQDTAEAIRNMAVRGAGAIGAAAGFGLAQAGLAATDQHLIPTMEAAAELLRNTRPTAHDLFYAVEQVLAAARQAADPAAARQAAVGTAHRFADANAAAGEAIGRHGAPLLTDGARVLTQCNAGWLAFADWGSALAPVYLAHRAGRRVRVFVPETRPRGQGARLTAWELAQEGVPHTLVSDTACGSLFQRGLVDLVIVGADRIAANGDTANKIGTYTLAVLAHRHGVPFYVAAPRSTFDPATPTGAAIVIEERSEDEVVWVTGRTAEGGTARVRIAPEATPAANPAFDVTPAALIRGFITEVGLLAADPDTLARALRPALAST